MKDMTNEQAKSELMQIYGMLSEEKKQALDVLMAQADGDLISRQQARSEYADWYGYGYQDNWFYKRLGSMPSVDIPPEHDGCKDCVYQDNPQDAMPCRECKHNYMDKFERAKVGHWKEYSSNWLCDYCNRLVSERSDYCPNCGAKMD